MKTSNAGIEKLMKREGLRTKAYRDTKGIWTIGVGDTDVNNDGVRDVYKGMEMSVGQAMAGLKADLSDTELFLDTHVFVPLTQNQFDALVSFVFNVGMTAFKNSTMRKKINLRDFKGAAKEFDRWHIPPEIIGRRDGEKAQFSAP